MSEDRCRNCGQPKVEGRLNCPQCGAAYEGIEDRGFEPNPEEQGEA